MKYDLGIHYFSKNRQGLGFSIRSDFSVANSRVYRISRFHCLDWMSGAWKTARFLGNRWVGGYAESYSHFDDIPVVFPKYRVHSEAEGVPYFRDVLFYAQRLREVLSFLLFTLSRDNFIRPALISQKQREPNKVIVACTEYIM